MGSMQRAECSSSSSLRTPGYRPAENSSPKVLRLFIHRRWHAGHTSWSTSGLGFLTLWLMGKLHVFDGTAHPSRIVAASVPISLAIWIGITRLQDYWHHWQVMPGGSCQRSGGS